MSECLASSGLGVISINKQVTIVIISVFPNYLLVDLIIGNN